MNKFQKRTLSKTLTLLLGTVPEWVKASGKINVSRAAKDMGMRQPTLKRWVDGVSLDPDQENRSKLCKRFKINFSQLIGEAPIPLIDGDAVLVEEKGAYGLPPKIARIIEDLLEQDAEFQDAFAYSYLAAKSRFQKAAARINGEVPGKFAAPTRSGVHKKSDFKLIPSK